MTSIQSRQSGAALLVCLIMLLLMSMFAATSFNLGKSSLQIADNLRQRNQAGAVAQQAIEAVISKSTAFTNNTGSLYFLNNNTCPDQANTLCVDVNGDGKTVVTATLTPPMTCLRWAPVPQNDPRYLQCSSGSGSGQSFGVTGANTSGVLCADSMWEINALATDPVSEAQITVTEGVGVAVPLAVVATICPLPSGSGGSSGSGSGSGSGG